MGNTADEASLALLALAQVQDTRARLFNVSWSENGAPFQKYKIRRFFGCSQLLHNQSSEFFTSKIISENYNGTSFRHPKASSQKCFKFLKAGTWWSRFGLIIIEHPIFDFWEIKRLKMEGSGAETGSIIIFYEMILLVKISALLVM